LDENMPPRDKFPRTNWRFDIKHLVSDFKKTGLKDPDVHEFASKEKRIIITFNESDFKSLASKNKNSGVIAVSSNLNNDKIDKKLLSLFSKHLNQLYGNLHKITGKT